MNRSKCVDPQGKNKAPPLSTQQQPLYNHQSEHIVHYLLPVHCSCMQEHSKCCCCNSNKKNTRVCMGYSKYEQIVSSKEFIKLPCKQVNLIPRSLSSNTYQSIAYIFPPHCGCVLIGRCCCCCGMLQSVNEGSCPGLTKYDKTVPRQPTPIPPPLSPHT